MNSRDTALVELGWALKHAGYHFATVTPETHRRIVENFNDRTATPLTAVFGWSRAFASEDLPPPLLRLMDRACVLEMEHGRMRSAVRFSTLGDLLFVHSSFPTADDDSVFFGPDTYRFAHAIRAAVMGTPPPRRIADIGCGSGAGGLYAASLFPGLTPQIVLSDINDKALRYSAVNARLSAFDGVTCVKSDVFGDLDGSFDLILSNPPYLVDGAARLYRHGGGDWGFALSLRILEEGLAHLAPRGTLLLYTGAPIIGGHDPFLASVRLRLDGDGWSYQYEEIDPDVFGEELTDFPYTKADRIAVVALTIRAREKA